MILFPRTALTAQKMADDKVRIVSTQLIQAAMVDEQHNNTPTCQRIPLTPCDLRPIFLGTNQKGLVFPKPNPPLQYSYQSLIQQLQSSFSQTLSLFYPLAGRFSADQHPDGTASIYIDCNNAGALFVRAVAHTISLADILDPLYVPPLLWSFFPLNWVRNYHGFSQPFLAVQITELVDGIFVACMMNHAVADGTAFWRFMNSWSEICRDSGIIYKSPVFTRKWFLDEKHPPIIRIPWTMIKDFKEDDSFVSQQHQLKLKERVFHFSRHKLVTLKAQANAEAIAAGGKISTLQSLISHIWRAVTRNRSNPDPDRDARFKLLVGLRSRLQPKIPENYLGNAITGCAVVLKEKVLLKEKGLGEAAAEINKVVIENQNDEKLKKAVESWIGNPQMLTIGVLAKDGGMGLSSSPRYDIYGNDFGWGKPVAVRSGPGNKVDGKVTVFPGVDEGSMDVEICLSAETMERLGIDSEFMAAVGV
ncbi:Uncharacterized acetyltransferase At3g50280 [Linum grandiflorum]